MKQIIYKAAILGVLVFGGMVAKDQAYNGVPPPPTPSVEFMARLPFSEGFDPPRAGDTNPATGAKDEDDWVPYTSIAKTGPYAVNEKCKLVFLTNEAAALCEIVVAADSRSLITIGPSSDGGVTVLPSGTNTNITITALGGNATIREATIQARLKIDHTTVAAQLRVMLLPERTTVQAKFYRVCNANDHEFVENPTENPIADPGEATAEADSRMAQAVVSISPAPPIPPVYGDFSARVLFFDFNGDHTLAGDIEYAVFTASGLLTSMCDVVYVPWLAEGYGGMVFDYESKALFIAQNAWTFPGGGFSDDPEDGNGVCSQMERAFAHEFGHYLKTCSRTLALPGPRGGHDDFPHPSETRALMRGGVNSVGRWMRHEDWVTANLTAKEKTQ